MHNSHGQHYIMVLISSLSSLSFYHSHSIIVITHYYHYNIIVITHYYHYYIMYYQQKGSAFVVCHYLCKSE